MEMLSELLRGAARNVAITCATWLLLADCAAPAWAATERSENFEVRADSAEVARTIAKHGTARVSAAVFAAAVPPCLLKKSDNPEGPLDEATIVHEAGRTMAQIVESVGQVRAVIEEIRTAAQRQGAVVQRLDRAAVQPQSLFGTGQGGLKLRRAR